MSTALLFDEQACPTLAIVAPMLEHAEDGATRRRLAQLDKTLAVMVEQGYEIGTPRRVRPQTKYAYSEWHIPIKRSDASCLLSFFVNEVLSISNEKPRKTK